MTSDSIALQLVSDRLSAATGMDVAMLDSGRLRSIVRSRCGAVLCPDALIYAQRLQEEPAELHALIDECVVQETRFFRDPAVFAQLRRALPLLAHTFSGNLRILSAPCGTGQEAYSLTACAVQAGLPLERITIDAFDISVAALRIAEHAAYPVRALRPLSPDEIQMLGTLRRQNLEIHPQLRATIHFERRNLIEPGALAGDAPYHLILCRNLFIYLHPRARATLARSLAAALVPGGQLVLGSADRVEEIAALFAPLRPAASFAFTHRTQKDVSAAAKLKLRRVNNHAESRTHHTTKLNPAGPRRPSASVAEARPIRSDLPVPTHSTALELYERALHHHRHGNDRSAERRCRQALYLAPKLLLALELLQTLWQQQPNTRLRHALSARIVRTRLADKSAAVTEGAR
jgi:chemotaxis protein methyltransferase WspC